MSRDTLSTILALAALLPAAIAAAEQQPGYGVVESITATRHKPAEPSASAGASAPSPRSAAQGTTYRVRVRLDDGSVQVRDLKKREFSAGDRVLLTNAGDVVPDLAQAPDAPRGSVPPGRAADGSRPADGAITGGSILPGETSGVPGSANTPSDSRIRRCNELSGTLREECLSKERGASVGSGPKAPGADAAKTPDAPPPQNPR
jgi:hypothetical protein